MKMTHKRAKPLSDIFQGFPPQPRRPHFEVGIDVPNAHTREARCVGSLDVPNAKISSLPHQGTERCDCQPSILPQPCLVLVVRPEGANHQWRRVPPRELSIDLVADERLGRVTGRAGASRQRSPWAAEQSDGP